MEIRQLSRVDLNLLIALDALLEECNVSRAAERLFITQPAMSKTLTRLRALFNDPLFTRAPHGMKPTPRAMEIKQALPAVLESIRDLIVPQHFEPAHFRGEITVALSEYIGLGILPPLMEKLQEEAPHLRIRNVTRVENQLEQLAEGNIDFSIHIARQSYSPDFNNDALCLVTPLVLGRAEHPLQGRTQLSWNDIAAWPQVHLYIPDLEQIALQQDSAFYKLERDIEGVFQTTHMLTAMEILKRTNCLMMGPPFLPYILSTTEIKPLALPEDYNLCLNYRMVTHRRTDNSAVHQWLKEKIKEVASTLARFSHTEV